MLKSGAIWALGAMSGTSLDGVDAAMVLTDGHKVHEFGPHAYRPYTPAEQAVLRAALGCWPGDAGVAEAAEAVETAHAEVLARFSGADIVGFHGQTLAHDPAGCGTHQVGDGAETDCGQKTSCADHPRLTLFAVHKYPGGSGGLVPRPLKIIDPQSP